MSNKTVDAATIMQYEQGAQAFIDYGRTCRQNEILERLEAAYKLNCEHDTKSIEGLLAAIVLIEGEH